MEIFLHCMRVSCGILLYFKCGYDRSEICTLDSKSTVHSPHVKRIERPWSLPTSFDSFCQSLQVNCFIAILKNFVPSCSCCIRTRWNVIVWKLQHIGFYDILINWKKKKNSYKFQILCKRDDFKPKIIKPLIILILKGARLTKIDPNPLLGNCLCVV